MTSLKPSIDQSEEDWVRDLLRHGDRLAETWFEEVSQRPADDQVPFLGRVRVPTP